MEFYNTLSSYYDIIFPVGEAQLKFIKKRAKNKKKVLDLAAGSGNYSIALAKEGLDVTAVDLDKEMISKLNEKNLINETDVEAFVMDMKDVDKISGKFDLIICIGNSLVHLENSNEIKSIIKKLYNNLNEDGVVIIQIVNYDRILNNNIKELPTIDRGKVKFIRKYDMKNGKILFKGTIVVKDINEEKIFKNMVELYPLKSMELKQMLENSGYKDIEFYGNFNEDKYSTESMAMVVEARK